MAARTPCSVPSCDDGPGEPCTRHETEQAHAEGEHAFCGYDCEAGDFGHRPVTVRAAGGRVPEVCARCRKPDVYGYAREDFVRWPCTTAVVLGLIDRAVA